MDKTLQSTYINKILLEEGKKSHSKLQPVSKEIKRDPVVKSKTSREFDMEKDVDLTDAFATSGPNKVKKLHKPKKLAEGENIFANSKFDTIFRRTLLEDTEGESVEDVQPGLPEQDLAGNEGEHADAADGSEAEEHEGEGDVVADLQKVVDQLQDILQTLGGGEGEEEEEGEKEEEAEEEPHQAEDVNSKIDQAEGAHGEEGVKESLDDLRTAIQGLKSKISGLTGKANKVKNAAKVKSGHPSTYGKSVELKPLGKSDLTSKNNKVNTSLKVGKNIFEARTK